MGGADADGEPTEYVEVLDLSTLRWSSGGARPRPRAPVPALSNPREGHAVCSFGDGRTVVAGSDVLLRRGI